MKKPLDCNYAFLGALALGASLLFTGPAIAQNSSKTEEVQVSQQVSEDDEVICRTFALTGTRIQREYCLTKGEWDYIREDSRDILELILGTGTGTGASTGG